MTKTEHPPGAGPEPAGSLPDVSDAGTASVPSAADNGTALSPPAPPGTGQPAGTSEASGIAGHSETSGTTDTSGVSGISSIAAGEEASEDLILSLDRIVKTYPGVRALDGVSLGVRRGEIHGLVGENGAGKSTLIKTVSGAISPDTGTITVDGRDFRSLTPKTSEELGISVIYQEFNLAPNLSAAENIFLGRPVRRWITVDRKAMAARAAELFAWLGVDIDPDAEVSGLTVGYQQIVEIAKAVSRKARLLIMDEPSAPLTSAETSRMLKMARTLRDRGCTIIYISHRLDEIFSLCDRVTVLRDGGKIATLPVAETDVPGLVSLMVGREMKETFPPRERKVGEEVILEARDLHGNGVKGVSFKAHKGEILGFGGLVGSGRTETAQLLFGARRPDSGEILLNGRKAEFAGAGDAVEAGVALVPEDRKREGLLLETAVEENISLAVLPRISRGPVVSRSKERALAKRFVESLKIKLPSASVAAGSLSGGNQQKVVLSKWLASEPGVIILDEPTRGVDVGAKYEIYKLIGSFVDEGRAVILISSEMEELIGLSDRILVMSEGRQTGILERSEFSQERVMELASNVSGRASEAAGKIAAGGGMS
ncbi:MAG: sugar ABC transporter ATP-binding protein [Deltaproteobacteria bacterium]|jgi:ribose transport system ATP-binding protein|nr:sugar ABC transporter ATP-binding protein [Deltaproteobacteria bacterium]